MCTFTPLTGHISEKPSRGLDNSHGLDNLWIGQVANSEFVNITYGMIIFFKFCIKHFLRVNESDFSERKLVCRRIVRLLLHQLPFRRQTNSQSVVD